VLRYIARRLLAGILLLIALTMITFLIFRVSPVDAACLIVPCGPGTHTTDAQIEAARHRLGVDRPIYVQYGDYVWHLLTEGSFGSSFTGREIDTTIRTVLPQTAFIVLGGMFVLLLLAIPLGVVSALYPQSRIDRTVLAVSILGIALHPLVVGFLLRRVFGGWLDLAPTGGYCPMKGGVPQVEGSPSYLITEPPPMCHGLQSWGSHLILPWFTFALFFLPLYVRIIRTRLIETVTSPHVATARAKGASEGRILRKHVLRIAMLPVVPMVAMDVGGALMAAIYIEISFNFAGLGDLMLSLLHGENVQGYDLPLIAAITTVIGAFVIVLTLIADVVYFTLEPRARLAAAA
jgi:ABC-type dipeptide/oligopeptide/nickel transport system permease component